MLPLITNALEKEFPFAPREQDTGFPLHFWSSAKAESQT